MSSPAPVLVLGATGSFGGGVARELLRRQRPLRALARDPDKARRLLGEAAEILPGDVQDAKTLQRAADGCAAVVHGVNYPYHRWRPNMVTATENALAAARSAGAVLVFPGNVYGLGRQTDAPLDEGAPMRPCSEKGELRVELEERLRKAAGSDGVPVLVLRAGDYYGPTVRNGLVDRIFGRAARGKPMQVLGKLDVAHEWAYVPDLSRAAVELLDRGVEGFDVVHFGGHVQPQSRFLEAVARAAGRPDLAMQATPWWLLRVVSLLDPVARELFELRYLFDEAVVLDGSELQRRLPDYRHTPLQEAVAETLASYRAGSERS